MDVESAQYLYGGILARNGGKPDEGWSRWHTMGYEDILGRRVEMFRCFWPHHCGCEYRSREWMRENKWNS